MTNSFVPFGFQYYRAPTPEKTEWESDLKNIAAYGYNTVKYWIQWRWNEPVKGEYDFSDIDALMDLAQKYGLKVVLNTILEVSPVWLDRELPDSAMISARGERVTGYASEYRQIGGMPGPCYHHEKANEYKMKFLAECVKRYANHPALYIWDVWNEPELTEGIYREPKTENLLCYCPHSVRAFALWLQNKYGTVQRLNEVWGRRYQSFEEAEPARRFGTNADMIDWRLFFCDTITNELKKRVETVKQYDCVHPVMCHTVPLPLFNSITCCSDDFSIAKYGDFIGNSVGSNPMAADLLKSTAEGKGIINAEIHSCYGSALNGFRMPDVNDMLRHVFIPLVHGSKGFLYWQYRPELLGDEAPAWGNVALDGSDTPWNEITVQMNGIVKQYLPEILAYTPPCKEIAIYIDKANEIYTWEASRDTRLFTQSMTGAYNLFYRNNYAVDFVDGNGVLQGKLSDYKAVYFPATFLFDEQKAQKLTEYVSNGGIAIVEALFGNENELSGRHCKNLPGCGIAELLGVKIEKIFSSTMIENGYDGKVFTSDSGEVIPFYDGETLLSGSRYMLTYTGNAGKPLAAFSETRCAAAEYRIGKGKLINIATLFAHGYHLTGNASNLRWLRKIVGEPYRFSYLPAGLRADEVAVNGRGFTVVENATGEDVSFTLKNATVLEVVGECTLSEDILTLKKDKTALIKIKR
ncbi:MAG: beta-galactosidase [Clostridia bacterium]|nr:beta-galactosidase [Clostridia bacterium]